MFSTNCRALVDHELGELIARDSLLVCPSFDLAKYVQPASIDLPLSSTCYLVKDRVLPYGRALDDLIPSLEISKIDLTEGAVLLKGQTYLALCGRVKMPSHCRGSLSPKSSIGRVDLMVRGVFDGCGLYDTIAHGVEGNLWMEINPRSFNVRIRSGQALSQMMVFVESKETPDDSIETIPPLLFNVHGEPIKPMPLHHDGSVILHLGLDRSHLRKDSIENNTTPAQNGAKKKLKLSERDVIGWEALPTSEIVDLAKIRVHPASKFFRPIYAATCDERGIHKITLEKDRFYILSTKERISVPVSLSAEMVPFSHHIGELRAHYAGFFDPGFGFGRDGLQIKGTVGVLEVRPHETITIFDGQPICLIEYFKNNANPTVAYGDAGNSYQNQQGAKLAKYFDEDA